MLGSFAGIAPLQLYKQGKEGGREGGKEMCVFVPVCLIV